MHLIKLCVGISRLEDLAREMRARQRPSHVTRMTPRRGEELLAGGSLYWVIAGWTAARQRLLALEPADLGDGIERCRLVLDPKVVATEWRPRRPFQGWRYLAEADAPPDLGPDSEAALPQALRAELAVLGLL